jgi:hypothetical protein
MISLARTLLSQRIAGYYRESSATRSVNAGRSISPAGAGTARSFPEATEGKPHRDVSWSNPAPFDIETYFLIPSSCSMPTPEGSSAHPRPGEPRFPTQLPEELAAFLADQDLVALWHPSDLGALLVLKARTPELESLGGTFPVGLEHQLFAHPRSPVVRSLITFHDHPDAPLRLETFTNVAAADQRAAFAALADQATIPVLGYDEQLRHRLSKRVTSSAAEFVPAIVSEADRLLAAIPEDRRDFDAAKRHVLEVTEL